jgi:hypothetical protein
MVVKKLFIIVIGMFFIVDVSAMQVIKKIYDWHDERSANYFIENFSSNTCADSRISMRTMSSNARQKIFEKNELKAAELHSAVLILGALPYELQKEILEKLNPIFVDHETTKYFLNEMPLKNALRWYAVVDKKMGDNSSYLFKKRTLFDKKFSCELTKSEMLRLSVDEVLILEYLEDSRYGNSLVMKPYKSVFNKKALITLQQLLQKGYLPVPDKEYTVSIGINQIRERLLRKFALNIALPTITTYCAQQSITWLDPAINSEMRSANAALEELEALGKGPFLKHTLQEYICSPGSLFRSFFIKFLGLFPIAMVEIMFPRIELPDKKSSMEAALQVLLSLVVPGGFSCVFFLLAMGNLIRDVHANELRNILWVEFGMSLFFEGCIAYIDDIFKGDKAPSYIKTKTINISEIPGYLDSWLVMLA